MINRANQTWPEMAINRAHQTWPSGDAYELPAAPQLNEVLQQMRLAYQLPASWPGEKDTENGNVL